MKKKIAKQGPDMNRWKDYRIAEDVERHKHSGDYISSRDLYDKIQDLGLFNKDLPIEIDTGGMIERPAKITGFRVENGIFIIEAE